MQQNIQAFADKFAISLSAICTIHCLAMPVLLVAMPSLAALQYDNEAFHLWMIIAVIPTSVFALSMGCKKHKRYQLLAIGAVGLALLALALVLGESWEKPLTLMGTCIIAVGHVMNYRLCQHVDTCNSCASE